MRKDFSGVVSSSSEKDPKGESKGRSKKKEGKDASKATGADIGVRSNFFFNLARQTKTNAPNALMDVRSLENRQYDVGRRPKSLQPDLRCQRTVSSPHRDRYRLCVFIPAVGLVSVYRSCSAGDVVASQHKNQEPFCSGQLWLCFI